MKKKEKEYVEFRYYEIPQRVPLIALMGERWVTRYGSDPMHFHNYMEIGYCCYTPGKRGRQVWGGHDHGDPQEFPASHNGKRRSL